MRLMRHTRCHRVDNDMMWASEDPNWVGRASMSQHHRFLVLRDQSFWTSNIAFMGLKECMQEQEEQQADRPAPQTEKDLNQGFDYAVAFVFAAAHNFSYQRCDQGTVWLILPCSSGL